MKKGPDSPMNRAPRCGARNRAGNPCQAPAMRGRQRCRLHGGKSTGPPKGNRNAWKHGLRSAEFLAMRRLLRGMRRGLSEIV